ncbi:MAG: hypothetical protein H6767_09970 [Candidatus Peribacteria bacterium]|nr:MAG: hypothetical protein H6767_09970 [Candidatus Peribacteria bacterium]
MKHLIFRLFFIIVVIIGLVSYTVPWSNYGVQVPFSGADYRLGLDLQGGIELDYKVDLSEVSAEEDYDSSREKSIIEGLKSIIDKRVETLNINDSVITSASYAGEQHIIVQIPLKGNSDFENSENIRRAKEAIGRVVKIEFKELRQEITEADINARNELAYQISEELSQSEYDFSVTANKYVLSEENIRIGETTNFSAFSGVTAQSFTDTNIQRVQDERGDFGYIIVKKQTGENPNGIYDYLFVDARPSEWKPAADTEGRVLDDRYFVNSSVQFNDAFQPLIELTFNSDGAEIFGELTKRLVGKPIAIFVGGELLTSPTVNEPILTGRAVITGQYTPESARQLSNDINTGVVPAPIYLTSERSIDSKL